MKRYPYISALLFDQPWATTERALESLIRRVEAAERREDIDLEAVAAKLGRPLENTGNRVEMRDSVAVLDITGPIFRYANIMTALSGATSVETLARDFQTALDNPLVTQILFNVDSPGGEIGGISDLADMIYAARDKKPITAFIDGLGASAAYWLASASGKVYASKSAFTGSIGVVASLTDRSGAQERQGIKTYTIVSSQSPRKVADPSTEDGRAAIQEMVDSLGATFVDTVANFRGVTSAKVLSDFGKGFVLPSRIAEKAGMIDGVTNFETLVSSLQNHQQPITAAVAAQETIMPPEGTTNNTGAPLPASSSAITNIPTTGGTTVITGSVLPDAAAEERNRIQAIMSLPEAQGRGDLARALAFEPGMTPAAAQRILAAAPTAPAPAPQNTLEQRMAQVKNPVVGTGADQGDASATEAQRILAFLPSHQKIKIAQN
jgi:signal peptide peptidase SppA